jgi:hypothetical protein
MASEIHQGSVKSVAQQNAMKIKQLGEISNFIEAQQTQA